MSKKSKQPEISKASTDDMDKLIKEAATAEAEVEVPEISEVETLKAQLAEKDKLLSVQNQLLGTKQITKGEVVVDKEKLARMLARSKERIVTIVVAGEQTGRSFPITVGMNGIMWEIPRNVPVQVTESVVHILNNALQTLHHCDAEGVLHESQALLYPFQVVQQSAA